MQRSFKLSNLALVIAMSLGSASGWTQTQSKLTSEFAGWAGSTQNAQALVTGLRNDSTITLTSTPASNSGTTATSASFTPATGTLGNGEVRIALSLAKADLSKMGIANPTPDQISAALNGGTITSSTGTVSTQGVLGMRASGMGWGNIAKSLGVKVGGLMRSDKADKADKTQDAKGTEPHKTDSKSNHDKGGNGGGGKGGGGGK